MKSGPRGGAARSRRRWWGDKLCAASRTAMELFPGIATSPLQKAAGKVSPVALRPGEPDQAFQPGAYVWVCITDYLSTFLTLRPG